MQSRQSWIFGQLAMDENNDKNLDVPTPNVFLFLQCSPLFPGLFFFLIPGETDGLTATSENLSHGGLPIRLVQK